MRLIARGTSTRKSPGALHLDQDGRDACLLGAAQAPALVAARAHDVGDGAQAHLSGPGGRRSPASHLAGRAAYVPIEAPIGYAACSPHRHRCGFAARWARRLHPLLDRGPVPPPGPAVQAGRMELVIRLFVVPPPARHGRHPRGLDCRACRLDLVRAARGGARAQVVTGLLLVGLNEMNDESSSTPRSPSSSSSRSRSPPAPRSPPRARRVSPPALVDAAAGLTVLNVLVAVLWH